FSDLRCYGGEVETPNLDRLAKNGLRFTQFYNTARCWPSRASILTGYYPPAVRRDVFPPEKLGERPKWAALLPAHLPPPRYRPYPPGRWPADACPVPSGSARSYRLDDQDRYFSPRVHYKDDENLPAVKPDSGYYATTAIADHAIECLKEHAEKYA